MRKVQVRTKCNRADDFGVLGRRALVRSAILIILLCILTGLAAAAEPNAKNVLVLNSFSERSLNGPLDPLESSLRARVPWPINFYVEYLENRRFGDKGYEKDLVENLRNTYVGKKLDLV